MSEYRERELKRKIAIHELQIGKHRKRVERAQEKIYICENELKEIQELEESIKNIENLKDESYLSQFDAKKLKGE